MDLSEDLLDRTDDREKEKTSKTHVQSSFYIELIDGQALVCSSYFPCFMKFFCVDCARVIWNVLLTTCILSQSTNWAHFPLLPVAVKFASLPLPTHILFLGFCFMQYIKRPMETCPRWCPSLSWSLATLCSYLKEQTKSKTKTPLLICNPAGSDFSYPCLCCSLSYLVSTLFLFVTSLCSHICFPVCMPPL